MIYGEVAWPDLTVGWQHGLSDKVDIGIKGSLIYGFEYRAYSILGLGVRVPIRITPLKTGKVSLQIRFEPGLKFDQFGSSCGAVGPGGVVVACNNAPDADTAFGIWLPLALDVGIHLTREATLSFGVDAPFYVNLTNGVYGAIPLLFGPAFEYHIDDHISFGFNLKLGPSITTATVNDGAGNSITVTDTKIGFITQGFFAYKL
jgi:hypothetical protein